MTKTHLATDQIGTIAIIEIPPGTKSTAAKQIANEILASNKHIETVCAKQGAMHGVYRVWKLKHLAGKKTTKTTYRENNCTFELDAAKVYFSPRLAFERQRIAQEVKNGEKILVLFAGVAPFSIIIAKTLKAKHETAHIISNELNPAAVKYAVKNITANKVSEMVTSVKGDAAKILKKYPRWANRIVMPLPHSAIDFLPQVIDAAAPGCIVHFYGFGPHRSEKTKRKTNPFRELENKIKKECKKKKRKCKIVFKRIVRPYSPFSVQVVIDFKIDKT
ncbi:MAG: tRNA (guanine-N1)-methyltransferase [Candidatus Micrarchaeota archaeon]